MAENKNKTRETTASVADYLAAIPEEGRRQDCQVLAKLMTKATKHQPKMWGSSIVGFGSYHYVYDSGREGEMCLVGFSARKSNITLYGLNAAPNHATLLSKLGKYKSSKGCMYIARLSDIDLKILEKLVAAAAEAKKREQLE
ncbi:MAG: DUF1801 domain-containing protein [Gemmataceae bacterium]